MHFVDLQSKDVINVKNGKKIGYVFDLVMNSCFEIEALVVEKISALHFIYLFKQPLTIIVPVTCIKCLQGDVILVYIDKD